jgi:uncharacterized protein
MVGRKEEIEILESLKLPEKPAFVAVYGRRRVGKTYFFKDVTQTQKSVFLTLITTLGGWSPMIILNHLSKIP